MWGYRLANTLSVTLSHSSSSVIFFFHIGIKSINSGGDFLGSRFYITNKCAPCSPRKTLFLNQTGAAGEYTA
ncbi:hypothetical protein ACEE86_18505, partial [Proteus mirabilis]